MGKSSKEIINQQKEVIKEEVKLQYLIYLSIFFIIYYASYLIPGMLFLIYIYLFFIPNVLDTTNFFFLFTELTPFIYMILMPFIVIICYLLHLFFMALITRWFWGITEKKSPTKDGIIPRNFASRTLNYYHIRSFMIKYPKYSFTKGPFPWLSNWFFNFVKSSKIGKGTTIEEQVCADKYIDIGKNCYIGVNSVLTSHLVEGIFGNISYFELKIGDNVTFAGLNNFASGCKLGSNSFLMPWASGGKHYTVSGNNYYSGLPLRKIFKKKINEYLKIPLNILEEEKKYRADTSNLERLKKALKEYNDSYSKISYNNKSKSPKADIDNSELENTENKDDSDYILDFTTSSAISKISLKFLILYIPILWFGSLLASFLWYDYTQNRFPVQVNPLNWIVLILTLPIILFVICMAFIFGCLFFTKLFLILINLIHKPKEGVFRAEKGNSDFDFWCLRNELKKIPLFYTRNSPIPYIDAWAFRWFGISMDFSAHLIDAWCDCEFVKMGRKVMVGQGAVIMSSMVVGKYLFIKKVILDDYCIVGGQDTIAPGTIIGKDSVIGALSTTNYNQILEDGWIYFGIPCIKLKENKYAESKKNIIRKVDVDEERKYEVEHEVNIEKDKKKLL
ncbi:MAG: hypothetical protein ACTSPD_16810 [Promethearchaeota archaeon]